MGSILTSALELAPGVEVLLEYVATTDQGKMSSWLPAAALVAHCRVQAHESLSQHTVTTQSGWFL